MSTLGLVGAVTPTVSIVGAVTPTMSIVGATPTMSIVGATPTVSIVGAVTPTTTYYLLLAAVLFGIGAVGLLVRRNPLVMFMCIELMLNAVNLSFVAFAVRFGDIAGQTAVFFVLVVAAAEVVVGLGIIVSILRGRPGATADDLAELKG